MFKLYAPTVEERDLWINGFNSILDLPVADATFTPMGMLSVQELKQEVADCEETHNSEESEEVEKP